MKKTQAEKKYLEHIEMLKDKRFEKGNVAVTLICLHGVMRREDFLFFLLTWSKNMAQA